MFVTLVGDYLPQPSQKSFRIKQKLAKASRQNRYVLYLAIPESIGLAYSLAYILCHISCTRYLASPRPASHDT